MLLDNYVLLIKQFYRLPALAFLFFSSTHPIHQPRLSLDKRAAGRERTVRIRSSKDLRNPLWLSSSSSQTASPREGKGWVQGMGSKVLEAETPHHVCSDDVLNVQCRKRTLSLDGGANIVVKVISSQTTVPRVLELLAPTLGSPCRQERDPLSHRVLVT